MIESFSNLFSRNEYNLSIRIFNIIKFYVSLDKKNFDEFMEKNLALSIEFFKFLGEILKENTYSGLQDEVI